MRGKRAEPIPADLGCSIGDEEICPRCKGKGTIVSKAVTIGDRFLRLREAKGWNQAELAPMLGVSRPQIANIEGDRGVPGVATLIQAADVFGVTVDYLLGRKGNS